MKRRLFAIFSVLSLAMCVALSLLWVEARDSYECMSFELDGWPTATLQRNIAVRLGVSRGRLVLYTHTISTDYSNLSERNLTPKAFERVYRETGRATNLHRHSWEHAVMVDGFLGFGAYYITRPQVAMQGGAVDARSWSMPVVVPIILLCVPNALWLGRVYRRQQRSRLGLCQRCGYDLRATPERCPECGEMIPAQTPSVAGKV